MSKVLLAIISAFLITVAIAAYQAVELRVPDIGILNLQSLHNRGFVVALHNLGFVLGTGAATIINIFNVLAEKNEAFKQSKMSVVRFLFYFVWAGTLLMLFVHTAEFLGEQNIVHWAKLISVLAILIGVSYIWFYLMPRAKKLAPQPGEMASGEFLRIQKQLNTLPLIILFFWYMDFFLNSFWLPAWPF